MNFSAITTWSHDSWKKFPIVLFAIFLVVGTGLRFYKLDDKSLWYDELHSIIPTAPENSLSSVIEYSTGDQPPLFFILLHSWYQVFPYDEASGKTMTAILGSLGLIAVFFLGKELGGTKIGLAAMLVTACNIFHIYYSQELRFYSLLFLMSTVSFIFFIRFIRNQTARDQLLFTLSTIGLLYTHYFGIVIVLSQAVIFLFLQFYLRKSFSFFLRGLACALITAIAFSPWIPILLKDNQTASFWITDPGPFFFAEYFTRYFNGWWALSFKYLLSGLLLFLVATFFFNVVRNKDEKFPYWILIAWLFLTLAIPYAYTIIKIPMIVDRYTIITLPAVFVIVAFGWEKLPNRYLRIAVLLLFVVLSVRVLNRYYGKFKKPEYRELAHQIVSENTGKSPVLSKEAWHFNFFFKKYEAGYKVININEIEFSDWLKDKDHFYVIYPEHLSSGTRNLILKSFSLERELVFHQANAFLFKRKRND